VLVVEDEESFSDANLVHAPQEGFEVAVCTTGPDALETSTGPVRTWYCST